MVAQAPEQAAAPRIALRQHEPVDLDEALLGFAAWFGDESLPVWGNGATFDNVVLSNVFAQFRLDRPWSYKHDRCFRTIKHLLPPVPRRSSTASPTRRSMTRSPRR